MVTIPEIQKGTLIGDRYQIEKPLGQGGFGRTYLAKDTQNSDIVDILSNAPTENIRARVTFADDSTFLFPIGKGTVQRWKDAYSFNPACQPME